MIKNKRKRAIAVVLTAALMIGVIKENSALLMAVETFSGVKEMVDGQINGNRDFVILEIVDDASEASVGYLVSGQEPNAPHANADKNELGLGDLNRLDDGEHTAFLEKLRRQGLLAYNDNDDQSSYPIEHRVTERKYSDNSGEAGEEGPAEFQGYRERGLTMVSGYFVPVKDPKADEVYYYRLNESVTIGLMTEEELEQVAEELLKSYDAEGYQVAENEVGKSGIFFKFSVEEPDLKEGTSQKPEPEEPEPEEPEPGPGPEEPEPGPGPEEPESEETKTEGQPQPDSDAQGSNESENPEVSDEQALSETASDGSVIRVSIDLDRSVLVVSTDAESAIGDMMRSGASDDAEGAPGEAGASDDAEGTSGEEGASGDEADASNETGGASEEAETPDRVETPDSGAGTPGETGGADANDENENSANSGKPAESEVQEGDEEAGKSDEVETPDDEEGTPDEADEEDTDSDDLNEATDGDEVTDGDEDEEAGEFTVSYQWAYDENSDEFYYPQWVVDPDQDGCSWDYLPGGLELQDVVFQFNGTNHNLSVIKDVITLPEDQGTYTSAEIDGEDYKKDDAYKKYSEATEVIVKGKIKKHNGEYTELRTLGTYTFSGWTAEYPGPGPDEEPSDGEVVLTGTWKYTDTISEEICSVIYEFVGVNANGNVDSYFIPSNLKNGGEGEIGECEDYKNNPKIPLELNTRLPDNKLINESGAELSGRIQTPTVEDIYFQGSSYSIEDETPTVIKVTVNGELIGMYQFSGWTKYKDAAGEHDIPEGGVIENLTDDITIIGTWTYISVSNAKYVAGYGYQYEYIRDELVNHNWFKYYVLGLEESQWGSLNVKVATYTPDGRHLLGADFGSLTEAMNRADLVVLNADGGYTVYDENNHTTGYEETGRDIAPNAATILLSRACANKQEQRLAVVVDSSVPNARIGNMKKIAVLLQQPDIGRAYEDFTASARFEDDYDGADWISLRRNVKSLNGGNFVRENIYIVNYQRSSFKGTTYRDMEADDASVFSLANADFENQYSDSSVDSGFADVYRAILNENYTRGQNGQKSMDEYVTPAVAVAYILNYRNYDPVIYKDQIRVLELEPCMDYTYYYPGPNTDAGRKAKDAGVKLFIKDWAPSFAEKYAQNPNAVVIDGMTTAEFCGKIADVYEDYDLIYFGSNTGLMNTSGPVYFEWRERSYGPANGAFSNVEGFYWKGVDDKGRFSYIDGKWYVSFQADYTKVGYWNLNTCWTECDMTEIPSFTLTARDMIDYGGYSGWSEAEKHGNGPFEWQWTGEKWQLRRHTGYNDPNYPGDWVDDVPKSFCYERIFKAWAGSGDSNAQNYKYENGKLYRRPKYEYEDTTRPWVEEVARPGEWETLYSHGNEIDSDWMWQRGTWYQKETYNGKPFTRYNDRNMDGMVYTHVGDQFSSDWNYGGLLQTETDLQYNLNDAVSRYSGNDILEWQVDELLNFLKSGSPIIVANDFMAYDQQGQISGINSSDVSYPVLSREFRGILDTSSYVYRFVKRACDAGYLGNGLLVEGTHDSENTAIALNQQKLKLNLFSAPTPYAYTGTDDPLGAIVGCTYLQPEDDGKYYLNYQFSITDLNAKNPLTTRYDVKLFLDSNNDGIYNTATEELGDIIVINEQTGVVQERISGAMDTGGAAVLHYSLSAGTPYRVRRELPQGYMGCIGWKLTATQVGNTGVHDSAVGLTAVQKQRINSDKIDPVTGKRIIHVLQILSDGNVSLNLEACMEKTENRTVSDNQWKTLLESIPDFAVRFDSIAETDFAYSFDYDVHPDHYCELHRSQYAERDGHLIGAAGRDDYLNFYDYDMVILGFGDLYRNLPSKKATEALLAYGDSGKSLMYTHDTTYANVVMYVTDSDFEAKGDTSTLSMSIRNQCGMDRFGVTVNRFNAEYANNPIKNGTEVELTGTDAVSRFNSAANNRLGSDIAYKPGSGQRVMTWETHGFTYIGMNNNKDTFKNLNYKEIFPTRPSWQEFMSRWMKEANEDNHNYITRVNSGIITQYPYNVGGEDEMIRVSNTHGQYFQVDLDTDWDGDGRGDIVVWYCISSLDDTLAWNDAGEFTPNDIYDYSPNDVRNNYYIYNKGNITYTGVGHAGNYTIEEMKLFINTFIAAYNAGIHDPSVRIVDGASMNAPDLESVSLPFMKEDAESAGTQRVYYQVEDHNITTGTTNLCVTYYLEGNSPGQEGGLSEVKYENRLIPAEMYAGNPDPDHPEKKALQTYDAQTGNPVSYDAIRSGRTYYVDVPLDRLVENESFNLYVKIDLKLEGSSISAASDIDRLLIAKLKMFNLD